MMIVYQALYNWMTYESSAKTLSLHRTKDGAEKAIGKHKAKDKKEHDSNHLRRYEEEDIARMKSCGYTEAAIKDEIEDDKEDWPKSWQWWGISEIEIEE